MGGIMKNSIKSLFSNKQGLALVEFALFLPLILIMIFGVVEFTRYVVITQKAERSAYVLSNIMSQFTPIKFKESDTEASPTTIDNQVFPQFERVMDVFNTASDRVSIISSITRTGAANNNSSIRINWQRAGGGSLSSSEAVSLLNGVKAAAINSASANGSTAGTSPNFPSSTGTLMGGALKDMNVGENMIITETFYNYQPLLSNLLGGLGSTSVSPRVMKSVVFTRPRNGDISTLERPADPGGPGSTDESPDSCIDVTLTPPYSSCSSRNITKNGKCVRETTCETCTGKNVCRNCSPDADGKITCKVTSSNYTGCKKTKTEAACSTGGGGSTPKPPTGSPPPS
jgi:hypothetical protein